MCLSALTMVDVSRTSPNGRTKLGSRHDRNVSRLSGVARADSTEAAGPSDVPAGTRFSTGVAGDSLQPVDINDAPDAARLRDLWADHQAAGWPESVPGGGDGSWDQVGGEPVMLDAEIAGIVATVVGSRRPPDASQQDDLRVLAAELDKAWPIVPTEAQPYLGGGRLSSAGHCSAGGRWTGPRLSLVSVAAGSAATTA